MKKQLTIIATICALVMTLTSCASLKNNENVQTAITAAAALGTAYDLQQRPSDLPYFVAAEQELYAIANSTNKVDAKTIDAALQSAGQTNQVVSVAIAAAINIGNNYLANNNSTNTEAIKDVAGWVADGIAQTVNTRISKLKVVKKK
jgi:hypothetical protein